MTKACRNILFLMWLGTAALAYADQPLLQIEDLGPQGPSSFAHLLKVTFVNEKYVYVDLASVLRSTELWVDGQPSKMDPSYSQLDLPVSPLGTQTGCVAMEDYAPPLSAGKHRIQMKTSADFGSLESNTLKMTWAGPRAPASKDFKTRKGEVEERAAALDSDMTRACVELWFNNPDGGLQTPGKVRYYVNPEIKVEVPYDDSGGPGSPENKIHGRIRVYHESRIMD